MEKLLFVDACIRGEDSRTKRLCNKFIETFLKSHPDTEVETVTLRNGTVEPLSYERIKVRDGYVKDKDFSQPMFDLANQIKEADYIVMGTPYYDLSFASILKVYIENVMVADLTFASSETGFIGLCAGKKLFYITTAGGSMAGMNYGYEYMCGIANMLGIPETELIKAENLDIVGFDAEKILAIAEAEIEARFK